MKLYVKKPFVVLVCCDNIEDETPKNVISYFQTYSKFNDAPIVGTLIRTGGGATGHGNDLKKEEKYPKILDVYKAFEQAGRELATKGQVQSSTQKKTNKKIISLPPIKALKKKALEFARKEMKNLE